MITEIANISINGEVQDDLVEDIMQIEVEEDLAAADVFRVRLALIAQSDGAWNYADDERFIIWNRLSIEAGYPEDTAVLIDGYITHVELFFSGGEQDPYLEISGMDASAMMDLDEKQLAWVDKKDGEIAQTIFLSYGLSHEVEDTVLQHKEAVSTIMQTETDIRFLRRLAERNGFECFVKGGKGYFRSPNMQDPPQPVLAIQFGEESNLSRLKISADGTAATFVEQRRIDPIKKLEDKETLEETPRRHLGAKTLTSLRAGLPDGHRLVKQQTPASTQEMKSRLRNAYEGASRFVSVEGEVDSRSYGKVLRAKKLVTIKGIGSSYSGLYYVTRVKHTFTPEGYNQNFEGYRNAIGLTGDEDFGSSDLPIAIPTGIGGASLSSGNRVLPAQQDGATIPGGL